METIDIGQALENQLEDPVILNCYNQLKKGVLSFDKSFISYREKAAAIWGIRLRIAQEHKRHKYTEEEIEYWEKAIEKLDSSKADDLLITFGKSETDFFITFWCSDSHEFVSCIWLIVKKATENTVTNQL